MSSSQFHDKSEAESRILSNISKFLRIKSFIGYSSVSHFICEIDDRKTIPEDYNDIRKIFFELQEEKRSLENAINQEEINLTREDILDTISGLGEGGVGQDEMLAPELIRTRKRISSLSRLINIRLSQNDMFFRECIIVDILMLFEGQELNKDRRVLELIDRYDLAEGDA